MNQESETIIRVINLAIQDLQDRVKKVERLLSESSWVHGYRTPTEMAIKAEKVFKMAKAIDK